MSNKAQASVCIKSLTEQAEAQEGEEKKNQEQKPKKLDKKKIKVTNLNNKRKKEMK